MIAYVGGEDKPAYFWSPEGSVTRIPLPGNDNYFHDLNDNNEFIGMLRRLEPDAPFPNFTHFRYQNGIAQTLCKDPPGNPQEYDCLLRDINNLGDVVGVVFDNIQQHYHDTTFLWPRDSTTGVDLQTLIDPALGWNLEQVYSINDFGAIVGYGYLNSNYYQSFIMLPATPRD